jgi:hypothetical protein
LFVTGFADRSLLAGVDEARIVGKPFVPNELADKARAALMRGAGATSEPHAH